MIQMHRVVKTFKNAAGEFTALKGIDLAIQRGEFAAIVGKSGSGKSTLLNMITGIDHPTGGQVIVDGTDIYTLTESQRSLWRGKSLGIVFQFFQLLPMLTLLENVMLPMDYVNLYDFDERPGRAMELLEMVGLKDQANKLPLAVSTGHQQMAAVARSLATDAPLLVADEPTGNLDSKTAAYIIDIFEELVHRGKTIVMVTHDPSLTSRVKRTVVISDGELINETLAKALPSLRHRQMLAVTKKLERLTVPPNMPIIRRGEHVDNFYLIDSGEVEVVLERPRKHDVILSRLKPAEYFGEIELMKGGKSIASVRAYSDGPVELISLPREDFHAMLEQSPLTEEAIAKIVQKRLLEHQIVDRRSVSPSLRAVAE